MKHGCVVHHASLFGWRLGATEKWSFIYMHIVCIKINVIIFSTGTCLQIEEIQQYCHYLKILVI